MKILAQSDTIMKINVTLENQSAQLEQYRNTIDQRKKNKGYFRALFCFYSRLSSDYHLHIRLL